MQDQFLFHRMILGKIAGRFCRVEKESAIEIWKRLSDVFQTTEISRNNLIGRNIVTTLQNSVPDSFLIQLRIIGSNKIQIIFGVFTGICG